MVLDLLDAKSLAGLSDEYLLKQVSARLGDVARPVNVDLQDIIESLMDILAVEGIVAADELTEQYPKAPDVALIAVAHGGAIRFVILLSTDENFRGCVSGRTTKSQSATFVQLLGEAKVDQLELRGVSDHDDVLRL